MSYVPRNSVPFCPKDSDSPSSTTYLELERKGSYVSIQAGLWGVLYEATHCLFAFIHEALPSIDSA